MSTGQEAAFEDVAPVIPDDGDTTLTPPEGYTEKEWDGLSDKEREGIVGDDDENLQGAEEAEEQEGTPEGKDQEEEGTGGTEEAEAAEIEELQEGPEEQATDTTNDRAFFANLPESDSELLTFKPNLGPLQISHEVPGEFQAKLDSLDDRYEEGEITLKEYNRERDALRTDITNHQLAVAGNARQGEVWLAEQQAFLRVHPEYTEASIKGKALYGAIDGAVRELAAKPENNHLSGVQMLLKAHAEVQKAFGFAPAAPEQEKPREQAKPTPSRPAPKRPDLETLGDVPVSAKNATDDPFAAIDRLTGEAYEDALAKMTDAQAKAYRARP